MRFAELTIFVTATGALLAATFSHVAAPVGGEAVLVRKLAGVIVTLVFWVLQQRTMLYSRHYVARAAELEAELGFRVLDPAPQGWLGGHRMVRVLFVLTLAFWVTSIVWLPGRADSKPSTSATRSLRPIPIIRGCPS